MAFQVVVETSFLSRFGSCVECLEPCSGYQWCSTCEISALKRKFTEWTSGNIKVDNMIQQTQLLSNDGVGYLEFIPFENFEYVKYIERGAFSTIYSAIWINGPRHILDSECPDWIRSGPTKCALKRIDNSCNISQEYLDKILNYHKCYRAGAAIVDCFGVTRDPTGCYMFVTKFYEYGNLQEFLTKTMGCLCWRDIIDMLWGMVSGGLERIHDSGFYHGNLHCGNLLIDELPESIHLKISDVGLHGPADGPGSGVYGVLPYVAPEVLRGKKYTQESDIYSFGIIMWALSSFIPPFCQYPHDLDLAKRICDGLRPDIIDGTPEAYVTLMKQCWDENPNNRPKAAELNEILCRWVTDINDNVESTPISEQFDIAEEKRFLDLINKTFTQPAIHKEAVYVSRLLDFQSLHENSQ